MGAPSLAQLNMLSNWNEPIQSVVGTPGWTINPQGVLMQWQTGYASTAGTTITFAESFPNAISTVFLSISTANSSTLGSNGYVGYQIINNQQIVVYSVVGAPAVSALAIGY